jgi:hypothetical protein
MLRYGKGSWVANCRRQSLPPSCAKYQQGAAAVCSVRRICKLLCRARPKALESSEGPGKALAAQSRAQSRDSTKSLGAALLF